VPEFSSGSPVSDQEVVFLEQRAREAEASLRKSRALQEAELQSLAAELEEEKRLAQTERERVTSLRVRIERLDMDRQNRLYEGDSLQDLQASQNELKRLQHQNAQLKEQLGRRRADAGRSSADTVERGPRIDVDMLEATMEMEARQHDWWRTCGSRQERTERRYPQSHPPSRQEMATPSHLTAESSLTDLWKAHVCCIKREGPH